MGVMHLPDHVIPQPENPGSDECIWWDTGNGGMPNRTGLVGTVKFDKAVTLYVKQAPLDGTDGDLVVVNNNGNADVLTADEVHFIKVYFSGGRTQVVLVPSEACDDWFVNGSITSRSVL